MTSPIFEKQPYVKYVEQEEAKEPSKWALVLLRPDGSISGSFLCSVVRVLLNCGHTKSHELIETAEVCGKAVMRITTREIAETTMGEIKIIHQQAQPMIDYLGLGACPVFFDIQKLGS